MNHQPYDNWILEDAQVCPDDREALNNHLEECPECYQLQHFWINVRSQLETAPIKPAPAEFIPKWKIQFALHQKAQERRQARTLLICLGSSAGAILIALAAILLPDLSLISLTVRFLTTVVKLFNTLDSLIAIFRSLVELAPATTLVISGLLIAGWVSLAAFAWGISIWRVTQKGVKTK
ncbi:MAG: hypothetical protein NTZ74_12910 [Chloroflexi bacterium]|nr:hypothetical protein [Chloroflexota bacterium]